MEQSSVCLAKIRDIVATQLKMENLPIHDLVPKLVREDASLRTGILAAKDP